MNSKALIQNCPCGSDKTYRQCCELYHDGALAPSAEALMRSRYSGYVLKLEDYLLASWHPNTRPQHLDIANDTTKWLGLQVKAAIESGPDKATVEFVARYKVNGKAERLHELSKFVREDGRWYYLDGSHEK